jgi:hypothetical protein
MSSLPTPRQNTERLFKKIAHAIDLRFSDNPEDQRVSYPAAIAEIHELLSSEEKFDINATCRVIFFTDDDSMIKRIQGPGFPETPPFLLHLSDSAETGEKLTPHSSNVQLIHLAAMLGDKPLMDSLLKTMAPGDETLTWRQLSPMHLAAFFGNTECLQSLLDLPVGRRFSFLDKAERTPLYYAASTGHTQCMKLLLEESSHSILSITNDDSLHVALRHGLLGAVKTLLDFDHQFLAFSKKVDRKSFDALLKLLNDTDEKDLSDILKEVKRKISLPPYLSATPYSIHSLIKLSGPEIDALKTFVETKNPTLAAKIEKTVSYEISNDLLKKLIQTGHAEIEASKKMIEKAIQKAFNDYPGVNDKKLRTPALISEARLFAELSFASQKEHMLSESRKAQKIIDALQTELDSRPSTPSKLERFKQIFSRKKHAQVFPVSMMASSTPLQTPRGPDHASRQGWRTPSEQEGQPGEGVVGAGAGAGSAAASDSGIGVGFLRSDNEVLSPAKAESPRPVERLLAEFPHDSDRADADASKASSPEDDEVSRLFGVVPEKTDRVATVFREAASSKKMTGPRDPSPEA